ncbi:hypothetical protein BGZ60DRAFT_422535 [Tricladium varicosporioides]|nr:hypothetical protein BGZ60DRAFT_422535 [Hymenoscyphus varicosporioides]
MPAMSRPTSNDPNTQQTKNILISSTPFVDNQLRSPDDYVGTMQLSEDVLLPPIEETSSDSSGGVDIPRAKGAAHSRTPSLSFTLPPTNDPQNLGVCPAIFGVASGADSRLGMSEIAVALEGVKSSNSSGALLRPQSPSMGDSPSQSRASRRRSSSRINKPPHNVADEELPKERFHDSAFQQAFLHAKQVMLEFTNVLSNGSMLNDPDSTMKRLHEEARNLARFHCPSTRTIGFVGDSGVGKSSLLNSLLDYPGLARTSSSGSACTCVATEYHYHNTNEFAIEVQWFSMDEITAQLTELLQSYRRYHLDPEGSIDFKDQAGVAQDTIQEMFRGHFENELFLTQLPEKTVLETLRLWAREIVPPSADHREIHTSLEDCGNRLQQLTAEKYSTQGPAKWPYISKVKVFLNAYILSNGLVLVDLPGLRDLNWARRAITERYLLGCDGIFAICSISRATTDASVMNVFELAKQAGLSNIGIICTMSDAIKAEEARKGWSEEKANKIKLHLEAIETDRRDFEFAKAELAAYDDDFAELCEEEVKEYTEYVKMSKEAEKRKHQHELELKQYLINTRNAEVKQRLSDIYQNAIPGNDLEIFCVSNDVYWKHRDSPKDDAFPFLQLSGIFTVRKHCISMVAKSQLDIARKYVTDNIPVHLGEVELWVQSGAGSMDAERKERTRKALDIVEAQLKQELTGDISQINRIERLFTELFRGEISSRQRVNEWSQAAVDASKVWSNTYPPITYKYFCQHFGMHKTEKVGQHNWNAEAINKMASDLETPWQNLESTFQRSLEQDIESIQVLVDQVIKYIDTEIPDPVDSAEALCRTMRVRQRLLITDIERAYGKFQAQLSNLRVQAFSGIETSFIRELMKESYDECNAMKGPYSHSMRSNVITNRLDDKIVFVSLQTKLKNQFTTLAGSLQSDIEDAARVHLLFITGTLDIVRNKNVALESERDPEFRRAVEKEWRVVKNMVHHLQNVMSS